MSDDVFRPTAADVEALCSALGWRFRLELVPGVDAYTIWGTDADRSPYITRTLLPRVDLPATAEGGSCRPLIHRIWRDDGDRHLHNHPWAWGRFIILSGGYSEERLGPDGQVQRRTYLPGDVNEISANTFHRVVDLLPCTWTLGLVGPRVQDWGFMVDGAVVPHEEYFARIGYAPADGTDRS